MTLQDKTKMTSHKRACIWHGLGRFRMVSYGGIW